MQLLLVLFAAGPNEWGEKKRRNREPMEREKWTRNVSGSSPRLCAVWGKRTGIRKEVIVYVKIFQSLVKRDEGSNTGAPCHQKKKKRKRRKRESETSHPPSGHQNSEGK